MEEHTSVVQSLLELLAGQTRIERELSSLRKAHQETHAAIFSARGSVAHNSLDVSPVTVFSPTEGNALLPHCCTSPGTAPAGEGKTRRSLRQTEEDESLRGTDSVEESPVCVTECESSDEDSTSKALSDIFRTITVMSKDETEPCVCWPATLVRRHPSKNIARVSTDDAPTGGAELDRRIAQSLQFGGRAHIRTLSFSRVPTHFYHLNVIHPHSKFRLLLDVVSLFFLAFDLTLTPVILAWDMQFSSIFFVMSVVSASWWTVDIIFNFRTGFYHNGVLQMSHSDVATRYLKWFPVDATITLLDWMAVVIDLSVDSDEASAISSLSTYGRTVKVSKVLRLSSFLRLGRFLEPLERIGDQFVSKVVHHVTIMVILFSLVFMVNHILACFWFSLAMYSSTDTGYRWTDLRLMSGAETYGDFGFWFQYSTAFHWTLTQMTPGSMPVQPANSKERVFNIVCLFLGLLFFSSVISSMSAAFTQLKSLAHEREHRIHQLETSFRQKGVSHKMAVAVKKQVLSRMSQKKPLQISDIQAIPMLSLTLRADLMYELSRRYLRGQPLFRLVEQTDPGVLRNISVKAVSFKALLAQDVLFVHDDPCDEAYVVTSGAIRYEEKFSHGCLKVLERQDDAIFDVMPKDWLCWAALWSHWVHVGKAEAVPVSEVIVLNTLAVWECIAHSVELSAFFESYSVTFHQRLVSSSPAKSGMWPNDIQVPLTTHEEIVLRMQQRQRMWRRMSPERARELEQEVLSGRSVLVENCDGQAERVVAFTGLRLHRSVVISLSILAKKRPDGGLFEPEGKLIGVKQDVGELPSQALRSMLLGQLRPYVKELKILSFEREDRFEESARFNIPTKYIRAIYTGFLPSGFGNVTRVDGLTYQSNLGTSSAQVADLSECHMLHDSHGQSLCAFLAPEMVECLRRSSGRKQLALWVASLPPTM